MDRHTVPYTGRLDIVKMSILHQKIYLFNATPVNISAKFFVYIDKIILKFMWKNKGITIARTIFKN